MRAVVSLFLVSLVMAVLHRVTGGAPLEARATLALGFLLLAGYVGGELTARARLPRVVGVLVAGFAMGPAWLGLVRRDELEALRLVGDATVALIGLAAGAALPIAAWRQQGPALLRLAGGAIAVPFAAVTLVVLSVTPWFPLTVHQSFGDGLAVALALGTLATASSPAITMATIGEVGVRGPFARGLLSVTVLQDLAVVLLFALVLAGAKAATSAGALNLAVAATALEDLGGSLALGGALGFALGRYVRLLPRDSVACLGAAAFVAAAVARLVGLEPLLIGLAAGGALEYGARAEAGRLRQALHRGWLPLEVIFFALAGAALRLGVLADLWPWAALLVGLRAVSLRYGLRWAGRHAGVPTGLARDGWLGLVSQSGVALGLAQLARRAFPEWGVSLEALIVAMIGVHTVAGPMCCRLALVRARETAEDTGHAEASMAGEDGCVAAHGSAP
ncbi:MAG TPA: cation:proton antiporter [Gemmatimonadales bacterium]|nr:cation:proton antiporter [Gemmatimonadales bacterium]